MPDLTPYTSILTEGKWISKLDFIYRLKSRWDFTKAKDLALLQLIYRLNFRQIKKGTRGEVVLQ